MGSRPFGIICLPAIAAGLFAMVAILSLPVIAPGQTVTNVTATQRDDGSGLVDIGYTLSGASAPMTVSVIVSPDNGATWNVTPQEQYLSGDVGEGISNGTRSIVWNAGADRPEVYWPECRVEVVASGGTGPVDDEITINLPGDVPPFELMRIPAGTLELMRIPAATFVMGSPADERSRDSDEGPLTNVTLSQEFYMGKYEVTQAQWEAVSTSWPGDAPSAINGMGDNHPAYNVSWNDAQDFTTSLNDYIASSGQGPLTVRLPSEAEWEYAARAGTTTRFSFGDSLIGSSGGDECEDDGLRSQYMWYCGNTASYGEPGYGTKPVGQKLPNAFGLHDMHGNVYEWCQDWHSPSLPGGTVTDPTGPSSGSRRVLRGGYWNFNARDCRSANRGSGGPSDRSRYIGFRLAAVR